MTPVSFRVKKVYFFASVAAIGLIGWAVGYFGETNLPPLLPVVRALALGVIANLFFSYALFVSDPKIRGEKFSCWLWLGAVGLFLAFMKPVFSGDLMEYLIRGRMLAVHHVSPYRFTPNDFPTDLLRPFSIWVNNPDSYGPLSVALQTLPVMVFPTSIQGMIWSYKVMILAFFGLSAFFFWRITRLAAPEESGKLWAMFAFNPLLILMAFVDGHNDLIMMAFSVASLYFLLKKRPAPAFFLWTCGFLVKYMIFLQLPFMVLFALKNLWEEQSPIPWLKLLGFGALNLFFIAALFAPLWGGEGTFLAILRQKEAFYTNTVPYAAHIFLVLLRVPSDPQIVKGFFLISFGALTLYLFYRLARAAKANTSLEFFRSVSLVCISFYAALPSPMGAWYMVWAVFWIVLARWPKPLALLLIFSAVGALAFYKRPNFLAIGGAFLYLGWLLVEPRISRPCSK